MTPQEALTKMKELEEENDYENGHMLADDILIEVLEELGYTELTKSYNNVGRWYA